MDWVSHQSWALWVLGIQTGAGLLFFIWMLGNNLRDSLRPLPGDAPPEERRSIFRKAGDRPREARVDLTLGAASIFTAIGMASLTHDVVQWREFFTHFLDRFIGVFRVLARLLPIHVPDDALPLIAMGTGVIFLWARLNFVWVRAGLRRAVDATGAVGWMTMFVIVLSCVDYLISGGGMGSVAALSLIVLMLGATALVGLVDLLSHWTSDRLEGFYALQSVGWIALWGLVILFVAAKGLGVG